MSKNRIDEINAESISMQDLSQVVMDVERDLQEAVSILLAHGFTAREVLGLDKALQTTRGELANNLSKLSELDEEIKDLEKLIMDALEREDEEEVKELREQLRYKQKREVSETRGCE